jgi:acyl carrier protein
MQKEDILKKINEIFIDVLEDDDIVLTPETTANDVEEWDSLNHIHLVVAVEKAFKVRFGSQDIQKWQTVGDMVNSVYEKVGA